MSWEDLNWPVIPGLAVPIPTTPCPVRPQVSAQAAEVLAAAKKRQTVAFSIPFIGGLAIMAVIATIISQNGPLDVGTGLLVAGVMLGLVVIISLAVRQAFAPSNQHTTQAKQLEMWEEQHQAWMARERSIYESRLSEADRRYLNSALIPDSWRPMRLTPAELAEYNRRRSEALGQWQR